MNWNQQLVVITGAGGGMGRAYAKAFAAKGCRLALCDISAEGLAETEAQLKAEQSGAVYCEALDVADQSAVLEFANHVEQNVGAATVVINNAGIEGAVRPAWALEKADIERVMNINFYGVIHVCQAFLPQLMQHKESQLINVSSIFGLAGTPNHSDYCASKFAVRGYTEALMCELQQSPVRVMCVHPGGIATSIARKDRSKAFSQHFLKTPPEAMAKALIRAMEKKQSRLVYGNNSASLAWAARLLPLTWLNRILWRQMQEHIDRSDYAAIEQGTTSKLGE